MRHAGFLRAEAYTPFPIEGLAESFGFRKTRLPLVFLAGGLIGLVAGYFLCWYANVVSYPWNIGGRPPNSWPAFLSITVDCGIGGALLFGVIAMFLMSGLPSPYHPLLHVADFSRVSRDGFFLCIESSDPQFDMELTHSFLVTLDPMVIYEVPW